MRTAYEQASVAQTEAVKVSSAAHHELATSAKSHTLAVDSLAKQVQTASEACTTAATRATDELQQLESYQTDAQRLQGRHADVVKLLAEQLTVEQREANAREATPEDVTRRLVALESAQTPPNRSSSRTAGRSTRS